MSFRLTHRYEYNIHCLLGRYCDAHGFTAVFIRRQEIRIEVGEFLNGFPSEDFVFTWRDAAKDEMAIWVRDCGLVTTKPVAKPVRNQDGLNSGDRLRLLVKHVSVNLTRF